MLPFATQTCRPSALGGSCAGHQPVVYQEPTTGFSRLALLSVLLVGARAGHSTVGFIHTQGASSELVCERFAVDKVTDELQVCGYERLDKGSAPASQLKRNQLSTSAFSAEGRMPSKQEHLEHTSS